MFDPTAHEAAHLVFPSFRFGHDDPERALAQVDSGMGGFCLYGGEARQIADFTTELQARARTPLMFCADYEDGATSHCRDATALPSNMGIAASGRKELARLKAEITAREALALGVRWVLAPVVDLACEPMNPIVNVRSFGADVRVVTSFAQSYLDGLRRHGVLGCLKHFPGHGRTRLDSHLELPVVKSARGLLARSDLAPFRALAARADSIMVGHLAIPAYGGGSMPFSLSPAARRLLRGRLGFKGLVATDALDMRAISRRYQESAVAAHALRAGADILLAPKNPEQLVAGLCAALTDPRLKLLAARAQSRLFKAKADAGLFRGAPGPRRRLLACVGGARHQRMAERMAEACLAWHGRSSTLTGQRLLYAEPGVAPRDWKGRNFLATLRLLGATIRPASAASVRCGEPLVLGVFLRPRAYTGRITLGPRELAEARTLASRAATAIVACFGSPFVMTSFPGRSGLCAFSGNAAAQNAAARALSWGAFRSSGACP